MLVVDRPSAEPKKRPAATGLLSLQFTPPSSHHTRRLPQPCLVENANVTTEGRISFDKPPPAPRFPRLSPMPSHLIHRVRLVRPNTPIGES